MRVQTCMTQVKQLQPTTQGCGTHPHNTQRAKRCMKHHNKTRQHTTRMPSPCNAGASRLVAHNHRIPHGATAQAQKHSAPHLPKPTTQKRARATAEDRFRQNYVPSLSCPHDSMTSSPSLPPTHPTMLFGITPVSAPGPLSLNSQRRFRSLPLCLLPYTWDHSICIIVPPTNLCLSSLPPPPNSVPSIAQHQESQQ